LGRGESNDEESFLQALTNFLERVANAEYPKDFMTFLSSAHLIPLQKGRLPGNSVRPIAMGEVFRKLVSSSIVRSRRLQIDGIMAPLQLGASHRFGLEKIVHLARATYAMKPDHDIVVLDFKNAFNSVSRTQALQQFRIHFPELFKYVDATYGWGSSLWTWADLKVQTIISDEGAQQGDPLGPLLYCLATLPLLKEMQANFPGGLLRAYIDDITLMGPSEAIFQCLTFLQTSAERYGLCLNGAKCKVVLGRCGTQEALDEKRRTYSAHLQNIEVDEIRPHPEDYETVSQGDLEIHHGVKILGTPVGHPAYVQAELVQILSNIREDTRRLDVVIHESQALWTFLHFVVIPKVNYLLRTVPPTLCEPFTSDFEALLMNIFESVLKCRIDNRLAWDQIRLPIDQGGFGLGHFKDMSRGAYLASMLISWDDLSTAYPEWTRLNPLFEELHREATAWYIQTANLPAPLPDQGVTPGKTSIPRSATVQEWLAQVLPSLKKTAGLQHLFVNELTKVRVETFKTTLAEPGRSQDSKIRFLSLQNNVAGKFLYAWPSPKWHMSPDAFRVACLLRLGLPMPGFHEQVPCICAGDRIHDQFGNHALICKAAGSDGHNFSRHDQLVHVFAEYAKAAHIKAITTQRDLRVRTQDGIRTDLQLVQPDFLQIERQQDIHYDATVVHPNCESNKDAAMRKTLIAEAGERKRAKYLESVSQLDNLFEPLVFETYGNWGPEVTNLIGFLAARLSEESPRPISQIKHWISISLSVTLQKYNAKIILTRNDLVLKNSGLRPAGGNRPNERQALIYQHLNDTPQ
jgi:hypothetical protein